MKYFLLLMSVFIISCSSSSDVCDPNPCKDSEVAHKTICEEVGDNDFKCVCEDGFNDENGACKKQVVETCIESKTKCDGNNLLTCSNNVWESLDCSLNDRVCGLSNETSSCLCGLGLEENDEGVCVEAGYCDSATYGSAFGKTGSALRAELKTIVTRTFDSYGYDDGRIAMFGYIDNNNGVIKCIYTGEEANHPYVDNFNLLHKGCDGCADKPANDFFNWEHTWPKSKGSGSGYAKSDLHHLFPTRSYVNSARSSIPFGNVSSGDKYCDDGVSSDGACEGKTYVSKKTSGAFEVADQHKGNTARAMFYMYVKYDLGGSNYLNGSEATALREWHSVDPVDEKDRDRNNKVEMFQKNRNPFTDCPQFVDALFE